MSRREELLRLDRLAASLRLRVPDDVALNDSGHHVCRATLERMGLDPKAEPCRTLLAVIERGGQQDLLKGQPMSIRAAALGGQGRRKVRDGG